MFLVTSWITREKANYIFIVKILGCNHDSPKYNYKLTIYGTKDFMPSWSILSHSPSWYKSLRQPIPSRGLNCSPLTTHIPCVARWRHWMARWRSCGGRRFTPTSCPPWTCGSKAYAKYRLGARRKSSTPRTDTAMGAHATRKRRVGGSTRVVVVSWNQIRYMLTHLTPVITLASSVLGLFYRSSVIVIACFACIIKYVCIQHGVWKLGWSNAFNLSPDKVLIIL